MLPIVEIKWSAVPAVATVALQQGAYVGKLLKEHVAVHDRRPFKFFNKGQMATIHYHAGLSARRPPDGRLLGFDDLGRHPHLLPD